MIFKDLVRSRDFVSTALKHLINRYIHWIHPGEVCAKGQIGPEVAVSVQKSIIKVTDSIHVPEAVSKFSKWPFQTFQLCVSTHKKYWLTSKVKIFLQGNGFLAFSDSKNGNPAPLSWTCFLFIWERLLFFLPFGLPFDLPVGLYFFFLRFLFLNLSKIAFKVNGLGSKDESLDESLAWATSGAWTNFLVRFLCTLFGE